MLFNQKKELALLLLTVFLISCSDDTEMELAPSNASLKIQEQYQPFVDRFFVEAAKRKVDVSDSRLQVITGFPRPEYCGLGYSNYLGNGSMRVEISPEPYCWTERNDIQKEILMFHELGHAILGRAHKEGNYATSNSVSMMCSETCSGFFQLYNQFTPEVREYYIDELFDPMVDAPFWARKRTSSVIIEDNIDMQSENWSFHSSFDSIGIFTSDGADILMDDNIALSITSSQSSSVNTFSFWRRVVKNPEFPIGSGLRLSVDITTENLIGNGVSIALRTDSKVNDKLQLSAFKSTQGNLLLNEDFNNKTVSIDIGYFPEHVEQIQIFLLMLNETVGKAYFDNIKLELQQ